MSTQVKYTKTGVTLSFDDTNVSAPRVLGAYPYPTVDARANIIAVALEDGTYDSANFSGRKSIRITTTDDLSTSGSVTDVYSVHYEYTQADTTIAGEGELAVPGWPINILLTEVLPSSDYSFYLWRKTSGGIVHKWAAIALAGGTPPDNTLQQITDILSDHVISKGGEKIRINQMWTLVQAQHTQLLAQSLAVFVNVVAGQTYCAEAGDLVTAYAALASAIDSLDTFLDTTVDTDTSSITSPTLLARFENYSLASDALQRTIAYRLHPPVIYAFCNQAKSEHQYPMDPIIGEPSVDPNSLSVAEFQAMFVQDGVGGGPITPVVGKTILLTMNFYPDEHNDPVPVPIINWTANN